MPKPLVQFAASTAFALLAAAQGGPQIQIENNSRLLVQAPPLRGLDADPRSYLPSARQLLDQQQNRQRNRASTQRRIEESERRQTMERLNAPTGNCANQVSPGCAPRQDGN
jgi:hypothetical protein